MLLRGETRQENDLTKEIRLLQCLNHWIWHYGIQRGEIRKRVLHEENIQNFSLETSLLDAHNGISNESVVTLALPKLDSGTDSSEDDHDEPEATWGKIRKPRGHQHHWTPPDSVPLDYDSSEDLHLKI